MSINTPHKGDDDDDDDDDNKVRTDTTIPNNKPGIIIRDNEKRNVAINTHYNIRRYKYDQEKS